MTWSVKLETVNWDSDDISKGKVRYQMAKSKAQIQQTNEWQLSYSWHGTGIYLCIKLGFIASQTSHLYDSSIYFHYIYKIVWTK